MTEFQKTSKPRRVAVALALWLALWLPTQMAVARDADADLLSLSIEDLMDIEVTSASKRAQRLSEVPAAVTVLTSEDIRRSGMTHIADLLRMVPGLHVANIDSNTWAVTARGFNSQFANKLLVMIDGRSVYTPLFSGVYWDVQDVVLEDIDRIEVIRGPGGTVWGANAVNGVINIITKDASQTQGLLVTGGGGSIDQGNATARYGGAIGENIHYRWSVKYLNRGDFDNRDGLEAHDAWDAIRGSFRYDIKASERDHFTFQGDYYDGEVDQTTVGLLVQDENDISGGNVIARWERTLSEESNLQLQFYYDRTERSGDLLGEDRDTFDADFQYRLSPLPGHDLVWGVGYRMTHDEIDNSLFVSFSPEDRTTHLVSAFVQDEISLIDDTLSLTLGSKFENNDYTGLEYQPSVRVLWTPHQRHSAWASVSRAVRSPSRAENDITLLTLNPIPPPPFALFTGNDAFDSEDLLAFELGYRAQPLERVSIDVAAYYNDYQDLRSSEVGVPNPLVLPLSGANKLDAQGYGLEISSTWDVTDFWRLIGGYTLMMLDVDRVDGSNDPTAGGQEKDTPEHQFQLRSRFDLPWNLEFDTTLFYVGKVPNQGVGDYARLDARLGWRPSSHIELSVVGQNLTKHRHDEFGTSFTKVPTAIPRSVYGQLTLRY